MVIFESFNITVVFVTAVVRLRIFVLINYNIYTHDDEHGTRVIIID